MINIEIETRFNSLNGRYTDHLFIYESNRLLFEDSSNIYELSKDKAFNNGLTLKEQLKHNYEQCYESDNPVYRY